ncbi:MAG: CsbD family protein [Pirellulales bacterium]
MSAAEQRLFGHWDSLKGKIKEHWGQITDDELAEVEGQYDQLVGLIQQKTGEARQQIKKIIDELGEEYSGAFAQAKEAARDYAEHANEALHETAERVRESAREGFEQAHEVVRRRPAESVAVAFGTGLLVGVIVGLIVRSK